MTANPMLKTFMETRRSIPAKQLGEPGPNRDEIEAMLTEQRVNSALDRWLGQSRTQTQIRFREEAFQ